MLRPAGGGLYTVSSGRAEQLEIERLLYGAATEGAVEESFRAALARVAAARVAILGVPSDAGAGLVRGAAYGPQALRASLLAAEPDFYAWAGGSGVVDVGDVAVIPHLLHDDMVSEAQKAACRAALYPQLAPAEATALPCSPLSIAERAVERLFDLNPRIRVLLLGGDHSVAWPVVAVLGRRVRARWAIVQIDAHTDLLPERLGVRYCFATWAFHANRVLGGGGRLVQVGVRASRHDRAHWESSLGVHQIWADEVRARGEAALLGEIVEHLRGAGAQAVYVSNDIDGTDAELSPSTGAPEPGGLSQAFVEALIAHLGASFRLLGADVCEVAPPVGSAEDSRRTSAVGAAYVLASLRALLGSAEP